MYVLLSNPPSLFCPINWSRSLVICNFADIVEEPIRRRTPTEHYTILWRLQDKESWRWAPNKNETHVRLKFSRCKSCDISPLTPRNWASRIKGQTRLEKMSWFDSSFSFAKSALSQAQKSIDKVLDIKEGSNESETTSNSGKFMHLLI